MSRKESSTDLEAKLARLLDYQRALAAFLRIGSEGLSEERLLHYAVAHVANVTGINHTKALCYRPARGDLLTVAGVGWKPGIVGHSSLAIDRSSPAGRAIQTAAPVIVEDYTEQSEFRIIPVLEQHGIVSLVNVPVMVDGRLWGLLEVDSEQPRIFDDADVGFLTAYASVLGNSLQRLEAQQRATQAKANEALKDAQVDVRLRELQHRVKNNFQIILSILALQRRQFTTPEGRERIGNVMDRVQAIALAHDQLSLTEGHGQVEFADYLRALCANIDPQRDNVAIEVDAMAAIMPIDRAVSVGLIVNELVTNSLKYAFGDKGGVIHVTFAVYPDRAEACLTVEDNGKGMGPPRPGGLGLQLLETFALQLGGRAVLDEVEIGTKTRVCFPQAS
ncbi:sensor histidine kinase [Chelatococcus sp. GCM10030263]|uniref:sensor histidine kinase n=1 Tax=Chelatococcus sp. GCM10030263 TaxID=3273387 RepID=UPI00360DFF9C